MPCRKPVAIGLLLAWAGMFAGFAGAQDRSAFQEGLDAYVNGDYEIALQHWRPAAEAGDAVAAFNIGVLYAQGLGVDADPAEAVRWYRRSAHAGYANAQFNLGAAYYSGEGIEANVPQAVSWWERAAEQDHAEALYNLAVVYRRGRGVPQDAGRARALFERAASLGDSRAQQALVDMGPQGAGTDAAGADSDPEPDTGSSAGADVDESRSATTRAGEAGSLAAENPEHWTVQLFAGTEESAARQFARDHDLTGSLRIYRAEIDGRTWFKGVYGSYADRDGAREARDELARDLPGSEPWLRSFRAIQAEAVGEIVAGGAGGPAAAEAPQEAPAPREEPPEAPDPEAGESDTAARETAAGAEADDPVNSEGSEPTGSEASQDAGTGDTASSDQPEPETGGEQAALQEAQQAFNAQDYAAALAAWRPLAEEGVAEAQYGLGFLYESGWGVDQSYDEAFRWYNRAAQQGHVKAQYNLGVLYRDGRGVSQNDALGLYWIQTAADRGDERARNFLEESN